MSLSSQEIDESASALLAARESGETLPAPAMPLDVADAYAIQDAVARRYGGIAGWKVGARDSTATPTCAPLLRGTIITCGEDRDIGVKGVVGVEVEFAYRIGRDFTNSAALADREILETVTSAHIAVELCASRLTKAEQAPLWLLADNQMNERLVLGPAFDPLAPSHPARVIARLCADGEIVAETLGAHPAGDPRRLLCWAVRHCAGRFGGVKSSQIITTGSWTGMRFLTPPARVEAELVGFEALRFHLTNS
jgi:2-keto-4-pentenoate hydratase